MDRRPKVRDLYGFDFPDDLYAFWEFAKRLRPLEPLAALSDVLGARLAGPFDILYGHFDGRTPYYSPLLHWRYYLDPPEFFTVLLGGNDGLHWGYVLDDPATGSGCVAHYYSEDTFEIALDGDTLFEAVRLQLENVQADQELEVRYGLASEENARAALLAIDRVRGMLMRFATGKRTQTGEAYTDRYGRRGRRLRLKQVAVRTREGLGVVVPAEQYRPLDRVNADLRRELRKGDPTLILAAARQALADGFPGTALQVGKELWALNPTANLLEATRELLDGAYESLGRNVLREVLREHLTHRDRPYLDVLHAEDANGAAT